MQSAFALQPLPETIRVSPGELQDVRVVRQSIQQGRGEPLITEDLHPVGKTQVGGHDQRDPLIQRRAELEHQLCAGLRLMECLRLRVKDVDFSMCQITVRDGKGAHDLFDAHRKRAVFLGADQRQAKECEARNHAAVHACKETIQAMFAGAGFARCHFITGQQVHIIWPQRMVTEEHPKQRGPGQRRVEKALDGTITATLTRPSVVLTMGVTLEYRDPAGHRQDRKDDLAELAQCGRCYERLEAL